MNEARSFQEFQGPQVCQMLVDRLVGPQLLIGCAEVHGDAFIFVMSEKGDLAAAPMLIWGARPCLTWLGPRLEAGLQPTLPDACWGGPLVGCLSRSNAYGS